MQVLYASLLLLAVSASANLLTLQSPRFSVSDSTGQQIRSEPISLVQKSNSPVHLDTTNTLKITFQVIEKESGQGTQPHQTFLRFFDATSKEEGIQPIRVTPGGKARFELNMNKPPITLPPTSNASLEVSLYIGKPGYSPLALNMFDLFVPPSHPPPQHPDEASFHPLPEIHHTFRPDQKLPPKLVSAVFSGLVVAPWMLLFLLWSQVSPHITHAFSPSILPFILSLGAYEGLIFYYWVGLKLGQVLLYGAILSVITLFTGKQALASIATRRIYKH